MLHTYNNCHAYTLVGLMAIAALRYLFGLFESGDVLCRLGLVEIDCVFHSPV